MFSTLTVQHQNYSPSGTTFTLKYTEDGTTIRTKVVAKGDTETIHPKANTTVTIESNTPGEWYCDGSMVASGTIASCSFTAPIGVEEDDNTNHIEYLTGTMAEYTYRDFIPDLTQIDLSVYIGDTLDPDGDYDLVYEDGSEYSHSQGGAGEILWAHNAEVGTEAELISDIEDGDPFEQVWTVNGNQVSGRGKSLYFTLPDEDCSFDITRSQQTGAVPVVINSITNLDGGMGSYTASDFHL